MSIETEEGESAVRRDEIAESDFGGDTLIVSGEAPPESENLRADEPLDEPTADIFTADPVAALSSAQEIKAAVEALLFASPDPTPAKRICQVLGDADNKSVRAALLELKLEYETHARGMQILEVAGGYQMATREKFAEFVLRLGSKKKPPSLSGATLETLAIIAYRQPVIRAEVESVRGVESSGTIRNLLDLGVIEIVGRKEVIGRPPLYGTTEKFLKAFGLRRIEDLPSIRGLRERFAVDEALAGKVEARRTENAEAMPLVQEDLPIGETAGGAATDETSPVEQESTDEAETEKDEWLAEESVINDDDVPIR